MVGGRAFDNTISLRPFRRRLHVWKLVETNCEVFRSFQFRETRCNPRVDCFQVRKPNGNYIGVSLKWKLQETTDVMIPSGFQRVSIFGKPLFSPSAWVMIFTILVEPFLVIITINLICLIHARVNVKKIG